MYCRSALYHNLPLVEIESLYSNYKKGVVQGTTEEKKHLETLSQNLSIGTLISSVTYGSKIPSYTRANYDFSFILFYKWLS